MGNVKYRRKLRVGGVYTPPTFNQYGIFGDAQRWGVTGGGNAPIDYVTTFDDLYDTMTDNVARRVVASGIIASPSNTYKGYYAQGNKTLVGQPGTIFRGFGIWRYPPTMTDPIDNNTITRNIIWEDMPFSDGILKDYLTFKDGSKGHWVDHCEFRNTSGSGLDGHIDVGQELDGITISNNILRNHSRGILMGGSRTIGTPETVRATLYGNHFIDISERAPTFSIGRFHMINNLHEHRTTNYAAGYGQSARRKAQMHNSNNVFLNFTGHPLRIQLGDLDDQGVEWLPGGVTGQETNAYINSPGSNQLTGNNPIGWLPDEQYYTGKLLSTADVLSLIPTQSGATLTLEQALSI